MFYGRKKELKYLYDIYKTDKAEFITLYGRRRIGKTELLKQFSKDKIYIFYSAKECTDYEQLSSISEKFLGKGKRFENWEGVFNHIAHISAKKKTIIIFDEFPYMIKGNKAIASILQNVWDHQLKNSKVKLIICGSSMSFMEKKILSEKNPLFGRMTGIYKLKELEFYEIAEFFPNYNQIELITIYSILGGVPHYYLQFEPLLNIRTNILNNILNKGRILYSEVDFLIKQELREPQVYYTIIEKIAYGSTKLNDIYTKTQIQTNKLSVYLKNLIELNIIKKEYPITEKIKAKVNLHTGIYSLSNNYFKFFFRFVFPNISELEEGLIDDIYLNEIKPKMNEYISGTYEQLCISFLKKQIFNNKKPYRIKNIGRWWNKQEEIDIVGFNNMDEYIFGECKWRNQKCDLNVLLKLKEKALNNFKYKDAHYYIFSKSGFTKQIINLANQDNKVHLIEDITID